jgi:hypothetical protein
LLNVEGGISSNLKGAGRSCLTEEGTCLPKLLQNHPLPFMPKTPFPPLGGREVLPQSGVKKSSAPSREGEGHA